MSGGVTLRKVSEWNGCILIPSFLCFVGHTFSPVAYFFFSSTLRTALLMINGIDLDKNRPEKMNVMET